MELTLHPLSKVCHATGQVFAEGDRVICHLVREPSGEITRRDLLVSADAAYAKTGQVLCSWTVSFKPRHGIENPGRALKLTAENLFVTLADPAVEPNPANTPMLQFLALMLERKKVLRPRGRTADDARQVYEHARSHLLYEVPVGILDEAFFANIQGQLDLLVGSPKAPVAVAPEPAPAPATP